MGCAAQMIAAFWLGCGAGSIALLVVLALFRGVTNGD